MAKTLIVVDMQNDFVKGHMSTPEARNIIDHIKKKVRQSLEAGDAVWFTMDTHLEKDYSESAPTVEAATLPRHCIKGTEGWEIIDELLPYVQMGINTIEKPTFLGLGLPEQINNLSDTPGDTVELCGVCTDICVLSNALYLRAKYPKAAITVDAACCAGVSPHTHKAALKVMESCLIQIL